MVLKEEGPMERSALTDRVIKEMQLEDLVGYTDSTLDGIIVTKGVLFDGEGKLYIRNK